jgi:hypothetical protein
VNVHWIGNQLDVYKLRQLIGQPLVGADCEWKCEMANVQYGSQSKGVAVMQLSSHKDAFIVDMISLARCKELDQVMTELFTCVNTVVVGFAFQGDLLEIKKRCPTFEFPTKCDNLMDL